MGAQRDSTWARTAVGLLSLLPGPGGSDSERGCFADVRLVPFPEEVRVEVGLGVDVEFAGVAEEPGVGRLGRVLALGSSLGSLVRFVAGAFPPLLLSDATEVGLAEEMVLEVDVRREDF